MYNEQEENIFQVIYQYIYDKHGISYTNKESNFYTDLNLIEFDRYELYEFLQKKFDIKIPYLHFSNIGVLCKMIAKTVNEKKAKEKHNLINKIKNWWNVKAKFQNVKS